MKALAIFLALDPAIDIKKLEKALILHNMPCKVSFDGKGYVKITSPNNRSVDFRACVKSFVAGYGAGFQEIG